MAEHASADAIVVLGCALDPRGAPRSALRRRALRGVELFQRGAAALLVLSGGGRHNRSEAAAMAEIAREAGVPDAALLLETRSANTFENAVFTAALLRRRGLGRIILVSDRYHLPRARLLFRLAGLLVEDGISAASPGALAEFPLLLREVAASARATLLYGMGAYRAARRNRLLTMRGE
jgi:uncharacterized SAM-binding protein YcdF (DUF218 family)